VGLVVVVGHGVVVFSSKFAFGLAMSNWDNSSAVTSVQCHNTVNKISLHNLQLRAGAG